jgi:hypothetical protein
VKILIPLIPAAVAVGTAVVKIGWWWIHRKRSRPT